MNRQTYLNILTGYPAKFDRTDVENSAIKAEAPHSKYLGIRAFTSKRRQITRYRVNIQADNVKVYLGTFDTEREAAEALDKLGREKGIDRFMVLSKQQTEDHLVPTSRMRMLTIGGKTKTTQQWCDQYQINHGTYSSRINRGMTPEEALKEPINNRRKPVDNQQTPAAR